MLFQRATIPLSLNYVPTPAQERYWYVWFAHVDRTPTYMLLKRIEAACLHAASQAPELANLYWLLPYRRSLRRLISDFDVLCNEGEPEVVRYYLLTCPPPMIPICVWLISHFADRTRYYEINRFCYSESPQTRRHVAKALRKLEAWTILKGMAGDFPDDRRIQWYANAPATGPAHRAFKDRLNRYTSRVDASNAAEVTTPSQMPYWASDAHWSYTPPKSIAFIRRMLRRIRHWVRWGVT